MKHLILYGYSTSYFFYAVTLIAYILRWKNLWQYLSIIAITVNFLVLLLITISSGHFPFFNVFECLLFVTFILGGLGLLCSQTEKHRLDVRTWVLIEIIFLLGIVFFFPKKPSLYRPNQTFIWVVLFHGFRKLALATVLFSSAHFIRFRLARRRKPRRNHILLRGRNFLLLSTVFFLCSEYSGMIWCQTGWGDFWHWSTTFFKSTVIILCLMFAFHIPGKNHRSDDIRSVIGAVIALVMLTIQVGKGLS
jgi:ABC-type transport system involved in cytochrome c biogenesis permease subunit